MSLSACRPAGSSCFTQIDAASNRIANYLIEEAGVTPGSIVAVLVLRSPLMVATLLGVLKAGAGYLPLDHHHPEGRIAFMLEDAAVKVESTHGCTRAYTCRCSMVWQLVKLCSTTARTGSMWQRTSVLVKYIPAYSMESPRIYCQAAGLLYSLIRTDNWFILAASALHAALFAPAPLLSQAVVVQPNLVSKLPPASTLASLAIHTLLLHPEVPYTTQGNLSNQQLHLLSGAGFPSLVSAALPAASFGAAAAASSDWQHGQLGNDGTTCYIIYTSGSTGKPKGVVVMHQGLTAYVSWFKTFFGITAGDVFMQKTPTNFDASIDELWTSLTVGAPLVVLPPEAHRDVHTVMSLIAR